MAHVNIGEIATPNIDSGIFICLATIGPGFSKLIPVCFNVLRCSFFWESGSC